MLKFKRTAKIANGKDKKGEEQESSIIGWSALTIAIIALLLGGVLTAWHTVLFNQIDHNANKRENQTNELLGSLEYQILQLNNTIGYQQAEIDMLIMSGNSTVVETGVCHLLNGRFNFPNDVLANVIDTNQLVNYSVVERGGTLYAVFSNFSTPVSVTSYTTNRMLFPSFPDCDASYPDFTTLLTVALDGCTQDLTGQTFTPSRLNDIQLSRSRVFLLKSEQDKFEIANNTQKFFGHNLWWLYPTHCFQNQYSVYFNDAFFSGAQTNTYIFTMAMVNETSSMRIASPFMILLTNSFY